MPLYEFKCNDCGRDFEELIIGSSLAECPFCHSQSTSRLMSACARRSKTNSGGDSALQGSSGGCGSCMGGNCASCGR